MGVPCRREGARETRSARDARQCQGWDARRKRKKQPCARAKVGMERGAGAPPRTRWPLGCSGRSPTEWTGHSCPSLRDRPTSRSSSQSWRLAQRAGASPRGRALSAPTMRRHKALSLDAASRDRSATTAACTPRPALPAFTLCTLVDPDCRGEEFCCFLMISFVSVRSPQRFESACVIIIKENFYNCTGGRKVVDVWCALRPSASQGGGDGRVRRVRQVRSSWRGRRVRASALQPRETRAKSRRSWSRADCSNRTTRRWSPTPRAGSGDGAAARRPGATSSC